MPNLPLKSPGKTSFAKSALIRGKGSGTATPFGGVAGKKGGGGNLPQGGPGQESEANGILEGISSLHSWIKTQTMIRPTPKISRGKLSGTYEEDADEDVVITLTAKNPQAPKNVVRFDYTSGEYINIKLSETMIDHLEIESTCFHKDSPEAKRQIQAGGGAKNASTFRHLAKGVVKRDRIISMINTEGIFGLGHLVTLPARVRLLVNWSAIN